MNPFRWRLPTWLILIFTVLMVAWARSALSNTDAATTAIGATFVFGIWFVGFIILSIIWFMTRPDRRYCPVCGREVKRGRKICKKCGHDFALASAPLSAPHQAAVPIEAVGVVKGSGLRRPGNKELAAPVARVNPSTMFCPNCGHSNDTTARFCSECGQRLQPEPAG